MGNQSSVFNDKDNPIVAVTANNRFDEINFIPYIFRPC